MILPVNGQPGLLITPRLDQSGHRRMADALGPGGRTDIQSAS